MAPRIILAAALLAAATPAFADTAILGNGTVVEAIPPEALNTPYRLQATAHVPMSPTAKAAIRYEIAYQALSVIDGIETHYCVNVKQTCTEANPIFGKHPSLLKIVAVKAAGGALHYALFKATLDRNPKTALRLAQISMGLQGAVVALNARFVF